MTPKDQLIEVRDTARYAADPRDPIARLAAAFVEYILSEESKDAGAVQPDPAPVEVDPVPVPVPVEPVATVDAAAEVAASAAHEADPRESVAALASTMVEFIEAAEKPAVP